MSRKWTAADIPDLTGKVVVITGANSGIGYESTREFARKGAEVILASRDQLKAERAIQNIRREIPQAKLKFIQVDLSSLESIRNFAYEFKENYDRLDILLNNAGIMLIPYGRTEDGFERTVGTNHLGHFALTGLVLERLIKTPRARVINVASNAHYGGEMDFEDLLFEEKGAYTPMKAYGRSKLANLLFTFELQRRFQSKGYDVIALAAHPGISATELANHLFFNLISWLIQPAMKLVFQSSAMGALPSLRAAVDMEARGGQYYGPGGKGERSGYPVVVDSNSASKNVEDAQSLWDISQELTGIRYLD
jgi:NAD(P)-dependent dehydrogenase (short-subunit alcohol dehydrogenase family)